MQRYLLPDARFLPLGRHDAREKQSNLWWSGSGVRVKIACTRLDVEVTSSASDHAQWLGVMVDGAPVARFPLIQGTRQYTALAGLDKHFPHEITLLRDTQPTADESGPVVLNSVFTDGNPEKPAERPRLIEFLGDSLTVGEGTMGPVSGEEWRLMFISHMPAYPTLVSEALCAEKRVIALGGWGAARSWDNLPENRIGRIYHQLCAVTPGGYVPAPFGERKADAVVINLGTNDSTALSKMSADEVPLGRAELRTRALELMESVRSRYPRAVILWAYGLCGDPADSILRGAVEDLQANGDKNVHYLHLTPAATLGSRMHPSREAHQQAANEIIACLKPLLGLDD